MALAAFGLAGCITTMFGRGGGFDARALTLQTVDLFDQRLASRLAKGRVPWKGDWILRRDRLELIDQELRNTKPDLLLLQGVMDKAGSAAESDRAILGAGALADYDWRQVQVEDFPDTQETESLAVAAGLPARFAEDAKRETWMMGTGGYLMATTVDYEDQPVTVFNVRMPGLSGEGGAGSDVDTWYGFLAERILDKLRDQKLCPKRLVIGGYMPGEETAKRYSDLLRTLQLKDVAAGFCQVAARCYTATPTNDLFLATVGDESPSRTDKILVHQSAVVYSSARSFEESDPQNRYAREFGLTRLWPTQRFGWVSQVRLARCTPSEFAAEPP